MDHRYVRKKVKNLSIEEKAFILAWNNSEKYSKDYPARFRHSKSIINHYVKWVRYKLEVFEFVDCFSETVVLFKPVNNIKS